ncbi:ABC transporter ATP-binding protein [Piscicoccus intestinalis]|uniref:ABC transporter ATP-binding protein n=1 Tax=Piscicoccus intestinalis TaxID=746033 RepID=UPI0008383323|nr:ABC transporter ATP-binding protein [Piscicoccus intestinalis]
MSAGRPARAPREVGERLLDVRGVSKTFGSVRANTDITVHVDRGEVVALLGENGAGKSTLVKAIFGLLRPDSGTIAVTGSDRPITGPADAIARGIGMVHQHFQLVPVMTVAENIVLGHEPVRAGRVDLRAARERVRQLSSRYGLAVDPDARVEDLPVGAQQRVEILKALSRDVDLLILDEPTAVLTPQETDELLRVMRELADDGTSILFITHKLREVLVAADRAYVLRAGAVAGEVRAADTDQAQLARLMVGRDVVLRVEKPEAEPGAVVLDVADLAVDDDRGVPAVRGLSLRVRAGEILGVAGVEGNGQRELVEAVAGMRPVSAGTIRLEAPAEAEPEAGRPADLTRLGPGGVHAAGVGHIPEDREKHGLVGGQSIADNLVLNRFAEPRFARHGVRDRAAVAANATALRTDYDIRSAGIRATAGSLSGGNKQKVVVARELSAQPRLLVAAQPTRGVDVGSIEFIHRQIVAARDGGAAVLLVSAELDEVLSLSDRIVVLHEGRIVAEVAPDVDRAEIGRLMAGGDRAADEQAAEWAGPAAD